MVSNTFFVLPFYSYFKSNLCVILIPTCNGTVIIPHGRLNTLWWLLDDPEEDCEAEMIKRVLSLSMLLI